MFDCNLGKKYHFIEMTDKQMWHRFRKQSGVTVEKYDSWSFGDIPDELAKLVLEGKKTATASVYELYEYDNEELPKVGNYSVILDSKDQAVCVVVDTEVKIVPFSKVDSDHAKLEGEGNGSLEYWRQVHGECFSKWMEEAGKKFTENTKIVLERFEVVFKA